MSGAGVIALAMSLMFVSGCSRDSLSGPAKAEDCDHYISPGNGTRNVTHPKQPTACQAVVLMCNYCAYDADGNLTGSGSEPCGPCVGAEF